MMPEIAQFPHCDTRVLHAPGECEFCDGQPVWQALRRAWGIAFTGHPPLAVLPHCGKPVSGLGYAATCRQPEGHPEGECHPWPASEILPCPADFARPPDSDRDHRKWPGNRPEGYAGGVMGESDAGGH